MASVPSRNINLDASQPVDCWSKLQVDYNARINTRVPVVHHWTIRHYRGTNSYIAHRTQSAITITSIRLLHQSIFCQSMRPDLEFEFANRGHDQFFFKTVVFGLASYFFSSLFIWIWTHRKLTQNVHIHIHNHNQSTSIFYSSLTYVYVYHTYV